MRSSINIRFKNNNNLANSHTFFSEEKNSLLKSAMVDLKRSSLVHTKIIPKKKSRKNSKVLIKNKLRFSNAKIKIKKPKIVFKNTVFD